MINKVIYLIQGKCSITDIIKYIKGSAFAYGKKKKTKGNIDFQFKHNFIFISDGKNMGLFHYILDEEQSLSNVWNDAKFSANPILNVLFKIYSAKRKKKHGLPFGGELLQTRARKLKKKISQQSIEEEELCFLLIGPHFIYPDHWLRDSLKRIFPKAKICLYIIDQINVHYELQLLIDKHINDYDLIYSYDRTMSEQYGLHFHNFPVGDLKQHIKFETEEKYDICFVGKAKNRLNQIIEVYERCKQIGLRCCFYILWVKKQDFVYEDDIHYNVPLNYYDYLQVVASSKCLLEVIQEGSSGNTLRVNEAIALNKLFITNNSNIIENGIYDDRYMMVINDVQNITTDFFNVSNINYAPSIRNRIMLSEFLKDVEGNLK